MITAEELKELKGLVAETSGLIERLEAATIAKAILMEAIKEEDPEIRERIRQRIRKLDE